MRWGRAHDRAVKGITGMHLRARRYQPGSANERLAVWTAAIFLLAWSAAASATPYEAVADGNWHDPDIWQPRGVPGAGDLVLSLGGHSITVNDDVTLGADAGSVALTISRDAKLVIPEGVVFTLAGHFDQRGYRSMVQIGAGAAILFQPQPDQVLEWRLRAPDQRVLFAGEPGNRARVGLTDESEGHYFFRAAGHRDAVFGGSYGLVTDAFDPRTGAGWRMFLGNIPERSGVVADHIEFLRCGQVSILGLDAGEHTEVDLSALTFREQATVGPDNARAAFSFDGFGDVTFVSPPSSVTKRLRDIVSDGPINIRFVQGYTLENFVLGAAGGGNDRLNNLGGNALVQRNVFQASQRAGSATNLLASLTENYYLYITGDNPHGLASKALRSDAILRNYWFEPTHRAVSDPGDAVLTDGPQFWANRYQIDPPTLLVEHSGVVAEADNSGSLPTLMTFNNSEGIRVRLEHNVAAVNPYHAAIALDENGSTPTGTGLSFKNNVLFSTTAGIAIGGAGRRRSVEHAETFLDVDYNLYFGLQREGQGGQFGSHDALLRSDADVHSLTIDPQFVDTSRDLAHWDLSLGGPGTAEHAIAEMKKRNDDSGFNPAYTVENLIEYVATGFTSSNELAVGDDGYVLGPALYSVTTPRPPPREPPVDTSETPELAQPPEPAGTGRSLGARRFPGTGSSSGGRGA